MHASNLFCLTILAVIVVSCCVGPIMFRLNETWAHANVGWCSRQNATSYDSVCKKGYLEVPCRINQFTYVLMNGTTPTPYSLNLTLDSLNEYHPWCAGEEICSCYFDDRNITATLTFQSEAGQILLSIFGVSLTIVILITVLLDYLTSM
jgi:hypothetical protein